jgi:hypothetical protein
MPESIITVISMIDTIAMIADIFTQRGTPG